MEEVHLRKQLNEEIKLLDEEGNICTEKYVDLKEISWQIQTFEMKA